LLLLVSARIRLARGCLRIGSALEQLYDDQTNWQRSPIATG
jgi:hypothetical protein